MWSLKYYQKDIIKCYNILAKLIIINYVISVREQLTHAVQGRAAKTFEDIMNSDYCTREGAERIKQQIEEYWAERGREVSINLIKGGFLASMRSARTDVRSNMVNGIPCANTENFA